MLETARRPSCTVPGHARSALRSAGLSALGGIVPTQPGAGVHVLARSSEGIEHLQLDTAHQWRQEGRESTDTGNLDQNFERLVCVASSGGSC